MKAVMRSEGYLHSTSDQDHDNADLVRDRDFQSPYLLNRNDEHDSIGDDVRQRVVSLQRADVAALGVLRALILGDPDGIGGPTDQKKAM